MNSESDASELLGKLVDLCDDLGMAGPIASDLGAAIAAWEMLDEAVRVIQAVRSEQANATIGLMPADQIELNGITYHRAASSRTEWDGKGVLGALSQRMVTTDGEMIDAIPRTVLEHVIGGISGTSSNWKAGALKEEGIDPNNYRRSETTGVRFAKGPKWAASRTKIVKVDDTAE